MPKTMQLSPKQLELMNYILDNDTTELFYGGSAGGGKSRGCANIFLILVKKFPGIKLGVFRKTVTQLRKTTMDTFYKAMGAAGLKRCDPKDTNFKSGDWRLTDIGSKIEFKNGSQILFMSLDPANDPEFTSIGSLEIDFGMIDEAGEITKLAKDTLRSRLGRGVATRVYHLVPKLILLANPSSNFLRKEYYDPYAKLGGGESQRWQNGELTQANGEKIPAYRVYLRATAYDNPFLPQSYIDTLKSLPDAQRKRLLDGDWNFNDGENVLFSYTLLESVMVNKKPEKVFIEKKTGQFEYKDGKVNEKVEKKALFSLTAGIDVADTGKDQTVIAIMDQNTLIDLIPLQISQVDETPKSKLYAEKAIEVLKRYGFTSREAGRVYLEQNSVGAAMRDQMVMLGWNIEGKTATGKSRQENFYSLYLDMEQKKIQIYDNTPNLEELEREMLSMTVEYKGEDVVICPKRDMKEALGRSPDLFDAFQWAYAAYAEMNKRKVMRPNRFRAVSIAPSPLNYRHR